jgi:acyl-CoA synthetase (AMP-forming)/AMP-acid ligase II
MNYDALNEAEPAGEVLLRGPQLFSGYYKQVRQKVAAAAAAAVVAVVLLKLLLVHVAADIVEPRNGCCDRCSDC